MSKYPLIEKCGLTVYQIESHTIMGLTKLFNHKGECSFVRADDLEAFLDRAPVVKSAWEFDSSNANSACSGVHSVSDVWRTDKHSEHWERAAYQARLILIEEIKQESERDLLRELEKLISKPISNAEFYNEVWDLAERAKRLLERGK